MKIQKVVSTTLFVFTTSCFTSSLYSEKEASSPSAVLASVSGEATFEQAKMYLEGTGVPKDTKKAFELMKAAADLGYVEAFGGLGYFYSVGIAVPKNDAEAVVWFRKGAEKGSAKAQFNLGRMLLRGKGTPKNESQGIEWIKKSADQGLPNAEVFYGHALYFGKYGCPSDRTQAFPYLLMGAESGDAESQNTVAVMLESPTDKEPDLAGAESWYRKAAQQGHAKAQANLAHLLGPDSPDDVKRTEALMWLLLSAGHGEIIAQKTLDDIQPAIKPAEMAQAKKAAAEFVKTARPGKPE